MNIPSSTYRIQFHHQFTMDDLEKHLGYLSLLGVSTIYASPITEAVPGSLHGYDVIDPHSINPEIGSVEKLTSLHKNLAAHQMTWLQDIVPNHMAYSIHNSRLMDALERGSLSEFYNYFDIIWNHASPLLHNKVMIPVLTESLEKSIDKIKLLFGEDGFVVVCSQQAYPLSVRSVSILISDDAFKSVHDELEQLDNLSTDRQSRLQWQLGKKEWILSIFQNRSKMNQLTAACDAFNSQPNKMKELLDQQNYRFMPWMDSQSLINYRRFFTVNDLICLRMEDEFTFRDYHSLLSNLYNKGLIQGIRVDHIDGLYNPGTYCNQLRALFGPDCYIIAEKILAEDESIPVAWPIQGTTGYEFLGEINQLFTDKTGSVQLVNFYRKILPEVVDYGTLVSKNKKMILEHHMGGEWQNLLDDLYRLKLDGGFNKKKLKDALGVLLISLPVYRLYSLQLPLKGRAGERMMQALLAAKKISPELGKEIDHFAKLFFEPAADPQPALSFLSRMMQFTGPLTAKGVEDTTFYSYNPLISHDEVGESAATLAIYTSQFHQKMKDRLARSPHSLNATSTHDTKRGEDARLRLNILSEIPERWEAIANTWLKENDSLKTLSNSKLAPTLNDEYFIYQSIVGGLPADGNATEDWISRLKEYITKVVREGKSNSDWAAPNQAYEKACADFIDGLFRKDGTFLPSVTPFLHEVDNYAMTYALAMVLIKATAPGIPDIYQGSELFNYSFVDPDNRRPVDYVLRQRILESIIAKEKEGSPALFSFLSENRIDGFEKIFTVWKTLTFRKTNPSFFSNAEYIPLSTGVRSHVMAYARTTGKQWLIVVVPLNLEQKNKEAQGPGATIEPVRILLPDGIRVHLIDQFTGEHFDSNEELTIGRIFKQFPIAMLFGEAE